MAFVSIMFGSILGLISAGTGVALFDLQIWQGIALYSASGVLFSAVTILALLLRSKSDLKSQISGDRSTAPV